MKKLSETQQLLGDAEWTLRDFCYLPSEHHYTVNVLFAGAASLRDMTGEFKCYALGRPTFISDEPGTGKSLTADILCRMIPGGELIINPSSHGLMQSLKNGGCPGLEEVNQKMGTRGVRNGDLMAIALGAYKRGTKVMLQRNDDAERIEIHGPMIFTGNQANAIMHHPGYAPLRDRGYIQLMEKPPEDHYLVEYDPEEHDEMLDELSRRFKRWGQENWHAITTLDKHTLGMDPRIKNRPREIWTALFRVAAFAGGDWPRRVNDAAKALVLGIWGENDRPIISPTEELLWAVRATFGDDDDFVATDDLLVRLYSLPQSPKLLATWKSARACQMGLSRALGVFGIEHVREDGAWGYRRSDLYEDGDEPANLPT